MSTPTLAPLRWIVIHERGRYGAADCWWAFDTQHVSGTPARDVLCQYEAQAQDICDRRNSYVWLRLETSPDAIDAAIRLRYKYPDCGFYVVFDDMGISGYATPYAVISTRTLGG